MVKLCRTDEPDPPGFNHQRVLRQTGEPLLKKWRHRAHVANEIALFNDLQVFQGNRCRNRMPATGISMTKDTNLVRLVRNRLIDVVID